MNSLAIIIPCYNEAKRFQLERFTKFIQNHPSVVLFFADDGSTDATPSLLKGLRSDFGEQVQIFTLLKNKGKAEAVRTGMTEAIKNIKMERFAFLDADLATSLGECYEIAARISDTKAFVFGSRIKKLDNNIQRKRYRFVLGRIIATFISTMLRLPIYDSQCGCKIFRRDWAVSVFIHPFLSTWLFDVEIFYRLIHQFGRKKICEEIEEVPLKAWIDTEDSKVSLLYGIKVWFDLIKIYRHYK